MECQKIEYFGGNDEDIYDGITTRLYGDGDFRSDECVAIMKEAGIVVTNPPFSLLREYILQLMAYEKKFLIIGTLNAIKYGEIFPYVMNDKIWVGNNNVHNFLQPDGTIKKFGNVNWYTNLDFEKRHEFLPLNREYNECDYPKYETYDAIEVSNVKNIPKDYDGVMGVPISFIGKYNPEQFEIVGEFNHGSDNEFDLAKPVINGKELFPRIAIRIRK